MVAPVVDAQDRLSTALGVACPLPVVTLFYLMALAVLPVLSVGLASGLSRWWSGDAEGWFRSALRYGYALAPLGAGMWLAHYGFHLLTSFDAAVAPVQRLAADLGLRLLGSPEWVCNCCVAVAPWVLRVELLFLDLGVLLSLYAAYRIAGTRHESLAHTLQAALPWAVLLILLFAVGVWLVFQPMQMRGTMQMGG
jgi:hypothetical protein